MIYEFALDPDLVARWHDPREWAFFREAFGAETGRVGSAYPRKWRKHVVRAFHRSYPGATLAALQRLEARLDTLSERMVERDTCNSECRSWIEKAVAEHRERPFHGILTTMPVPEIPKAITPEMLFSDHPPDIWSVSPNTIPSRTAEEIAQSVAPLLTRCREVVFVDPWFRPSERRFRSSLHAMLKQLWGPESCLTAPKAQLVIAVNKRKPEEPSWLLQECRDWLPPMLPKGHGLKVTVLREREGGGEKVHNRYILTKFAGVSFGIGLDVANDGESGQSDDLCRLSWEQVLKRWGQYVSARESFFDVAAGPEDIAGIGNGEFRERFTQDLRQGAVR